METSGKLKLEYQRARTVANILCKKLKPHCHLLAVAGSVRRKNPVCGDIEIVCVPKEIPDPSFNGMFGAPELVRSPGFISTVQGLGTIKTGKIKEGRYLKIILGSLGISIEGIQLDLFATNAKDYGRQLAIRTGPASFSARVIAGGWRRKGWVGTSEGLRREEECEKKGKTWIVKFANPTIPPDFPTEEGFFEFLGIDYIEPERRYL